MKLEILAIPLASDSSFSGATPTQVCFEVYKFLEPQLIFSEPPFRVSKNFQSPPLNIFSSPLPLVIFNELSLRARDVQLQSDTLLIYNKIFRRTLSMKSDRQQWNRILIFKRCYVICITVRNCLSLSSVTKSEFKY